MNRIEDSYEGAVRRLKAMGHLSPQEDPRPQPVPRIPAPPLAKLPAPNSRTRDLEQLANLACEENERLETELATVRAENASLRRRIAMLEETLNDPRGVLGLPALPTGLLDDNFGNDNFGNDNFSDDDDAATQFEHVPRRRGPQALGVVLGLAFIVACVMAAGAILATTPINMRWASRPMSKAQLDAKLDGVRYLFARGMMIHPRYGRPDIVLPKVTAPEPPPVRTPALAAQRVVAPVVAPPAANAPPVMTAPVQHIPSRPAKRAHKTHDPIVGPEL
jgi:hypothetical protein